MASRVEVKSIPPLSMLPMVDARTIDAPASRIPDVVKATFQTIPNTLGLTLTEAEMEDIYTIFRTRVDEIEAPTALDYRETRAARAILMAPGGFAYALMNRVQLGDEIINTGSQKEVFHAVGLHDGGHYAIGLCDIEKTRRKLIQKGEDRTAENLVEFLQREAGFARQLQNVPGVIEIPLTFEENGVFYFVMKFYQEGDLFDIVADLHSLAQTFPLENRVTLCRKILQGVAGAHRQNLIHRDVKPENILRDQGDLFLCDFGFATKTDDTSPLGIGRLAGTAEYVAPEIIRSKPATQKCDTWSAGVLLYNILALRLLPWQSVGRRSNFEIMNDIPRSKSWSPSFRRAFRKQDKEIRELLSLMLKVNRHERISIFQALKRLLAIEAAMWPQQAAPREDKKEVKVSAIPLPSTPKPVNVPRATLKVPSRYVSKPMPKFKTLPRPIHPSTPKAKTLPPAPKPANVTFKVPSRYVTIALRKFKTIGKVHPRNVA